MVCFCNLIEKEGVEIIPWVMLIPKEVFNILSLLDDFSALPDRNEYKFYSTIISLSKKVDHKAHNLIKVSWLELSIRLKAGAEAEARKTGVA